MAVSGKFASILISMMTAVIMGIPVFGDEGGRRPEPFQVAMATKIDDPGAGKNRPAGVVHGCCEIGER